MGFEVKEVDHHRNGVGGVSFYVAIVEDDENGRMLVIDFDSDEYGHTAVLNLDKAAAGNIYMFEVEGRVGTGGNAWRGDRLGDEYREAIKSLYQAQYDALFR